MERAIAAYNRRSSARRDPVSAVVTHVERHPDRIQHGVRIKRILRRPTTVAEARFDWLDDRASERPEWIAAFLEMKTVWHPVGV